MLYEVITNFNFPYFSRDIAEFWRRWHISLTTWFRDYLYIPLGGSRGSTINTVRNIFIIFIVSGFWHGASWTFIFWGFLHACYFIPLLLLHKNRKNLDLVAKDRMLPNFRELLSIVITSYSIHYTKLYEPKTHASITTWRHITWRAQRGSRGAPPKTHIFN